MAGRAPRMRAARAPVRAPWRVRHLPTVAFALLVGGGALLSLSNPALLRSPEANVWDGSWAEAYQTAFDEASPLLGTARTVWGVLDLAVFGQGRPGVLVGRGGWLYSSEEFDVVADAGAAVEAWADAVAEVHALLAERDVELVVALVPAKAAMVPEHLPAPLPDAARTRHDVALAELHARGVAAPDLRKPLTAAAETGPVYLRTDTHWTPHGAEAAAAAIASAAVARTTFAPGGARFDTEIVGTQPLYGDLTAFLDLGPFRDRLGPPPDDLELRRTVAPGGAGADLFAEVRIPVALVGTSYSADERWNLAGALRERLGADVLQAARSGLGPMEPMRLYLDSEAFRSTPPDLVVWEIPERYLTLGPFVPAPGQGTAP